MDTVALLLCSTMCVVIGYCSAEIAYRWKYFRDIAIIEVYISLWCLFGIATCPLWWGR